MKMDRSTKIWIGVFVAGGIALGAYALFGGKKSQEKRQSFEAFEKAVQQSGMNWLSGLSHVRREVLIENWTKNLTKQESDRAIELAKKFKKASSEEKKEISVEGKQLLAKLNS
jgi:hypothetical protein